MEQPIEVADIFRQFGAAYRRRRRLPLSQLKAMSAIERCRTAALGGHVDQCDNCGYERISYNSCRNRHCPKCQFLTKEKWLMKRQQDLLPISYFHVVFTIPDELNPLALVNQQVIYQILFQAASETLMDLGNDPRHIGGQIGVIAVLHTWGQNLMDHPHLHCIVTGGGLTKDGQQWVYPNKMTPNKDFFIHVNIIADLFKKKLLAYVKQYYRKGQLKFVGKVEYLTDEAEFKQLLNKLYATKWVTYCKKPFGGVEQVLRYLGCYTHRVAISNHRIVKLEDGKVTFKWRDYRDSNETKLMTLEALEFIRRFLLHILPDRFYKIRYYGILSNRNHQTKLELCKKLLEAAMNWAEQLNGSLCWEQLLLELTGIDVRQCPQCQQGRMIRKQVMIRSGYAPP
jgi:predicted Zn-ribbon and HTH transcriptional regulator